MHYLSNLGLIVSQALLDWSISQTYLTISMQKDRVGLLMFVVRH